MWAIVEAHRMVTIVNHQKINWTIFKVSRFKCVNHLGCILEVLWWYYYGAINGKPTSIKLRGWFVKIILPVQSLHKVPAQRDHMSYLRIFWFTLGLHDKSSPWLWEVATVAKELFKFWELFLAGCRHESWVAVRDHWIMWCEATGWNVRTEAETKGWSRFSRFLLWEIAVTFFWF
jgi:hypothetical protein